MQKWEYMTLVLAFDEQNKYIWMDAKDDERGATARLTELGEQGWELLSVDSQQSLGNTIRTVFYLKRPANIDEAPVDKETQSALRELLNALRKEIKPED
jgi:hypothetical protein